MVPLSIALLSAAGVIALLYIPMLFAVNAASGPNGAGGAVGLLFLAILRIVAMLAGFLSAVPTGRLAPLAPTVGGQVAACIFAVLLVEIASNWTLWAGISAPRSEGLGLVGLVSSVALPGLLLAAGLCGLLGGMTYQRFVSPLFWVSVLASVVCWAVVGGVAETRKIEASEDFRQMRQREEEQQVRQAEAEFEEKKALIATTAVTSAEGLETLLAFTSPWQRQDLSDLATAKIRTADRYPEQLAAIMRDGTNRIEALGVLAQDAKQLPAGVERQCWQAVERFAEEFLGELAGGQTDPPLNALFRPALDLMDAQPNARQQHRRELLAVQRVVKKADQQHRGFSLEAMMRLRDIDQPQGEWAEVKQP